jgi:hypothetical protein
MTCHLELFKVSYAVRLCHTAESGQNESHVVPHKSSVESQQNLARKIMETVACLTFGRLGDRAYRAIHV